MNIRKQFIYTIATAIILSLAFISCNNDEVEIKIENGYGNGDEAEAEESVRKLPSRIEIRELGASDASEVFTFRYDNQNRMTEFRYDFFGVWTTIYAIEYYASGRVSRVRITQRDLIEQEQERFLLSFEYTGNNIILGADGWGTLVVLDGDGQMTRISSNWWQARFSYTDGNLTQINLGGSLLNYRYDSGNVLNAFRYVATPNWLPVLLDLFGMAPLLFPPSRNAPSSIMADWEELVFTHETDENGYIITKTGVFNDWNWNTNTAHFLKNESVPDFFASRQSLRSKTRTQASANIFVMTYEYILAQ